MTLGQIRESTKETLSVVDVAEALGTNPQTIRNQAQADPIKLGFESADHPKPSAGRPY